MGGGVSVPCNDTASHMTNLSNEYTKVTDEAVETDISHHMSRGSAMGLDKIMSHMRFYQNVETSEVMFLVGSDRIEDVPKIEKDEWIEVHLSGFQDSYVRQTMQSKLFAQRQIVTNGMIEDTASISTDTQGPQNLAMSETFVQSLSRDGHDDDEHEHDQHDHDELEDITGDDELFKSPTNSVRTDQSSQRKQQLTIYLYIYRVCCIVLL